MQRGAAAAEAAAKVRDSVRELREELEKQIATAGMSADAAKRWELAQKGVPPAVLAQVAAMQRLAEGRQAVADLRKELEKQIATAGMSADAAKRWELAQKGVPPQVLGQVAAMQRQARQASETADRIKELRDSLKQDWGVKAAQKGSAEAMDRLYAYAQLRMVQAERAPQQPVPQMFFGQRPQADAVGSPVAAEPEAPPWPRLTALLERIAAAAEATAREGGVTFEEVDA
jgi:hypothetical protein